MTDALLPGARQALARHETPDLTPTGPRQLNKARLDTLIARARSGGPADRRAGVLVDMTCSETGRSFVGVAERSGDKLRLVASMRQGAPGGADQSELLSGSYRSVEAAPDWVCPECHTSAAGCVIWTCDCAERKGAVHCGSRGSRASFCACGRYERRRLIEVGSVEVRGEAVAATSANLLPGRSSSHSSLVLSLPNTRKEK